MTRGARRARRAKNRAGVFCLTLSFILSLAALAAPGASAASVAITPAAGPFKTIEISDTLSCKVVRVVDQGPPAVSSFFGVNGDACGTFLAIGSTVYGPAGVPTLPGSIVAF